MRFAEIRDRAEARKGGADALEALLAESPEPRDLSTLGDDRILSEFSKRVFQSGFNWSVVEKKWPGFEIAFDGFDIARNAFMNDEDFDRHLKNTDIVRHAKKILSIRDNAIFLSDLAREHGSAGRFFQDWPAENLVGLWAVMKKRGARLGGVTGQYSLRFLGKDCFIISRSVANAMRMMGVIEGSETSQKSHRAIQAQFNDWAAETGETFTRLSRILAMSVDD